MPSPPRARDRDPLPHRVAGLLLIGALGLAIPARAQAPSEAPRARVAVLLLATGELDPARADALSEALIGAIAARGGVIVIGQEELAVQLERDGREMLDCVSSSTCLGRVGVQLGLAEVVAGTLARREGAWVFNLNRLDVRRGEMVGRVFREVEGEIGAVADALSASVDELYAPPEPPAAEPVPAPPPPATLVVHSRPGAEVSIDGALIGVIGTRPLTHEGLSAGDHEVVVRASGTHPYTRVVRLRAGAELALEVPLDDAVRETIHPLVWIGGGVAVAALGAGIAFGAHSQTQLELTHDQRIGGSVTRAEAVEHYAAREREAITADVLFGVAAAAAAVGVVFLFFPERTPLEVSIGPGGASVRGRF